MQRNIININDYKYLIEYYDAITDLTNSQYLSEFVMLRNYNILNELVHDNDIYIIEKKYLNEYINELKTNGGNVGNTLVFPVTNSKINSYSNSYLKFNDNFNLGNNSSLYIKDKYGRDVYELYGINRNTNTLDTHKKILCDKIRIYHPSTKKHLSAIIDISNYINNVRFHYLCKTLDSYSSNSEKEIKINNETYSEYIEVYFPNMSELFKIDEEGNYNIYYKEDFNIVASTQNEKFINSIMSNATDIEHYENSGYDEKQLVPFNLFIQPYRIVEEYAADSEFNYDNDLSNDEKIFVKLYLKSNMSINNNYLTNTLNIVLYPYSEIDEQNNLYILDENLSQGYISLNNESKFSLMSRLGFSDGIISIVSLFEYPNKSYFYSLAKKLNESIVLSEENNSTEVHEDLDDDEKELYNMLFKDDDNTEVYKSGDVKITSAIKEAYKYYNNIDDKYYNLFINEDVLKELEDIDKVTSISDEIIQTVKEVANVNYENKEEMLNVWKRIMKETIINEYEEEYGSPTQFLGFKIQIASDVEFKHIIYDRNIRINFNDIDDFAFKLNNIFERWEHKPDQLNVRCSFYDRILGVEIKSNIVIITKEWFKYLINDPKIYRLSHLSSINKQINENEERMKVIDLDNEHVNFINSIKCFVRKEDRNTDVVKKPIDQKIVFKPIFYKVKDLQNITLRPALSQKIGINLAEYMTKVDTFKLIIDNNEYVEIGRNDIFVIFEVNSNYLDNVSGIYNIINEDGEYISSGNWSIN